MHAFAQKLGLTLKSIQLEREIPRPKNLHEDNISEVLKWTKPRIKNESDQRQAKCPINQSGSACAILWEFYASLYRQLSDDIIKPQISL